MYTNMHLALLPNVTIGKIILGNKPNALNGYIEMLKSGSSDYSLPLLDNIKYIIFCLFCQVVY